jgi:hypothetical protein
MMKDIILTSLLITTYNNIKYFGTFLKTTYVKLIMGNTQPESEAVLEGTSNCPLAYITKL